MKSTGIVRRVDELGRIVLPIELRRTLNIAEKDSLEIYVDGASIMLKKYQPACIFCDNAKDSISAVNANIKKLGYEDRCRVYHCSWERAVSVMASGGDRFDIVFIDPPYGAGISDKAAATLYDKGLLAEGFIIALEHDSKLPPMIEHDKLEIYDVRHYGELTAISFIRERQ